MIDGCCIRGFKSFRKVLTLKGSSRFLIIHFRQVVFGGSILSIVDHKYCQRRSDFTLSDRESALATRPRVDHLDALARLIDAGQLKIFINHTFPLYEAQEAMDDRQNKSGNGKVVLTVN
jgi:NADPH:quinone reductase-like Zn-dependent oxidoreductase